MKIPFSPPDIKQKEIDNVVEVLKSGWITTGPKTKELEARISEYCNTEKSVCFNSATSALETTLRLLGIGEGDEVITSSYTYTASASVIHHVGAKIILADTAKDSFEMDYERLPDLITEKTKAIIPVDIAGRMCDYKKIFKAIDFKKELFVHKNDIQKAIGRVIVLADGAHSFGATYKGKRSGEVADFTAFSFHAVKNLTTAEGGAITWRNIRGISNEDIYKKYMILSLHGQTKDALSKTNSGSWEYDILEPDYKCNMTDIMAAIGLAQIDRYEEMLTYRRKIVEQYNKGFEKLNLQILNHYDENGESSGHLYIVRINEKNEEERNKVIKKMAEKDIATNVHYKPLPLLTAYKNLGFDIKDYPNAFDLYRNEITLPLNTKITEEQVQYIIKTFTNILKE